MSEPTALKPCPFCGGGKASLSFVSTWFFVQCDDDLCAGAGKPSRDEYEAIAAWNRRADGWRSAADDTPTIVGHYVIAVKDGDLYLAQLSEDGLFYVWNDRYSESFPTEAVWWMLLPEPPKEVSE